MYYNALQRVHTEGDWEGWIEFFLDGVQQVASEGVDLVGRLITIVKQDREKVASMPLTATSLSSRSFWLPGASL
ncbi:MAG TPA: hypothetical protein VFT22_33970 [Kofleriaceae bacterium]|nr:hypothetical protein [Kofleriaceae bacterium]